MNGLNESQIIDSHLLPVVVLVQKEIEEQEEEKSCLS